MGVGVEVAPSPVIQKNISSVQMQFPFFVSNVLKK
jgi:hypothetical protein